MSKPKILVIGSNSFSGSHFVAEALHDGHAVWGVSCSTEPHPVFLAYRWSVEQVAAHLWPQQKTFSFKPLISIPN